MSFDQFRLDSRLLEAISTNGFTEPTPIQQKAIPVVLSGRDVVGLAQTGTGKTAAFGLPILQDLLDRPARDRRLPRALILAPTRELAEQIRQSLDSLARYTKLRTIAVYGGVSKAPQTQALRRGVDIIVACPGRLLDLHGDHVVDLSQVRTAVLDEADHMLDMGFLPDVRRILGYLPRDRNTLLFSATMPDEIRGLASSALRDPVEVRIGRVEPAKTVTQGLYEVKSATEKTALLVALMQDLKGEKVLVFTRTKHRAMALARKLTRAGHRVAALQGNLSQSQRDRAITGFKGTKIDVLVATDIAARGIDVAEIAQVINYDITDTVEAYTHRIGRTGRAQKSGRAVTFVVPDDADVLRQIERTTSARIERLPLPEMFQTRAAAALATEAPEPETASPRSRPERQSRAGRVARADGAERSGRSARADRSDRAARAGRSDTADRPDRSSRSGRPDRRERVGGSQPVAHGERRRGGGSARPRPAAAAESRRNDGRSSARPVRRGTDSFRERLGERFDRALQTLRVRVDREEDRSSHRGDVRGQGSARTRDNVRRRGDARDRDNTRGREDARNRVGGRSHDDARGRDNARGRDDARKRVSGRSRDDARGRNDARNQGAARSRDDGRNRDHARNGDNNRNRSDARTRGNDRSRANGPHQSDVRQRYDARNGFAGRGREEVWDGKVAHRVDEPRPVSVVAMEDDARSEYGRRPQRRRGRR